MRGGAGSVLGFLLGVLLVGCLDPDGAPPYGGTNPSAPVPEAFMRVTSTAYPNGASIPARYSCDGEDQTPPWTVHDVPSGAASLAAIFDDPDAPDEPWVHWLVWDIPPDVMEWPEGTNGTGLGTVGINTWGRADYGGPCPPRGTHRYVLTVYALDTTLQLAAGSDRRAFEAAREGHVLAEAQWMGTYAR